MNNNNVAQVISANGIGVLLLVTTLLNFYRKYRNQNTEQKVFAAMLYTNLFQCFAEAATFLIDGMRFSGDLALSTALNAFLFANNVIYSILWSAYAELHVNDNASIQEILLRCVPGMTIVLGAVINLFTPVFFRITPDNIYERTPLFFLTYLVNYAYILMGTFSAYRSRGKGERYVLLPAVTFLMPVVVGSILQFLFPGIALMCVGAAIGLNYAYISLVDEDANIDPLSGAFSRHQLNEVLHQLPRQAIGSQKTVGFMFDIDRLKSINDQYGHLIGDSAIRAVGRILRRAAQGFGHVYRYAGDEFTIILTVQKGNEVEELTRRIREGLAAFNASGEVPCDLSLSMGYTYYEPGETSHDFILRMDMAMYQEKNKR